MSSPEGSEEWWMQEAVKEHELDEATLYALMAEQEELEASWQEKNAGSG